MDEKIVQTFLRPAMFVTLNADEKAATLKQLITGDYTVRFDVQAGQRIAFVGITVTQ